MSSARLSDRQYAQCVFSLVIASAIGALVAWVIHANFDPQSNAAWTETFADVLFGGTIAPICFPVIAGSLWASGLLREQWSAWVNDTRPIGDLTAYVRHLAIALAAMTPVYYSFPVAMHFAWGPPNELPVTLLAIVCGFPLFLVLGMAGLWAGHVLAGTLAANGPRATGNAGATLTATAPQNQGLEWPALCCATFLAPFFVITFLLPHAISTFLDGRLPLAYVVTILFAALSIGTAGILQSIRIRSIR